MTIGPELPIDDALADELDEIAAEPRLTISGISEDGEKFSAPISHEQLARARQLREQLDD
ncbi:MAG: hypothetical protein WAL38_18910 [Solirubrobacteraceae bacterium]